MVYTWTDGTADSIWLYLDHVLPAGRFVQLDGEVGSPEGCAIEGNGSTSVMTMEPLQLYSGQAGVPGALQMKVLFYPYFLMGPLLLEHSPYLVVFKSIYH